MSEDNDRAAADREAAEYAARIERNAAMFLAALITTNNDMSHYEEVKLALTYAELLAEKIDTDYGP